MAQFRILYRDFLTRILDLELLSSRGEIERLLAQFGALLAAFSFTFAVYFVPRYALATLPYAALSKLAQVDQDLLIATTMAVAGLFTVLAWNTVLPDRRDCLILGLLPIRQRTIFCAKLAALATILGLSIAAINLFTGLSYPFAAAAPGAGLPSVLRSFAAWWIAMIAAGTFVCCALLGIQGLAAQLLPYRLFLRLSSILQLGAFFVILAAYFLKPPFPHRLPSAWFLGLYQQLNGTSDPQLAALAARAWTALAIALPTAAFTFALAFRRNNRRIVEQPDIAPARRHWPILGKLFSRPIDRAIVLFTARTIARSRHHRLLLAAYGGIGLAIALAYARDLLYGPSTYELRWRNLHWNQPNAPLLVGSFILLFFAVIATRAVFSLPMALAANWTFRVTAVHPPAAYRAAIRKALLALCALPVWLAWAALYLAIWPVRPSLQHLAILAVAAILMTDLALYRFRKIPFACSYLPGKANLHVRLGLGAIGFIFVTTQGVELEYNTLQHPIGFLVLFTVLAVIARWAYRRTASYPVAALQFEDLPPAEIETLNLHDDDGAVPPDAGTDIPRTPFSFEQLIRDFLGGARILTRAPGLSAAAIAMIALCLGWNATIYSIVHSILSKPAPAIKAEGLVSFGVARQGRLTDPGDNSYPEYLQYAANSRTIESIAASRSERFNMILPEGASYRLRGTLVAENYFATLGVRLAMGREFTAEESRGAAPLAAIVAWPVWQTQFQAAPGVLGQTVMLNGYAATIVGVAPPHFHGTRFVPNLEICVPLIAYARLEGVAGLQQQLGRGIEMIGRLAGGASLTSAQAEFDTLSQRLQVALPESERGKRAVLAPYTATAFGPNSGRQARLFLGIVMAVTLLTLLIVCANVANLMLARSIARQREIAVRLSMGASRARLLRMLLAEGLVLSLTAAGVAWLFASWATRALVKLLPPLESGARFDLDLTPDWRVAVYALALALAGTLAFTMAPALRAWRQELLPIAQSRRARRDRRPLPAGHRAHGGATGAVRHSVDRRRARLALARSDRHGRFGIQPGPCPARWRQRCRRSGG
ncbi:MAG: ABC transporter permease [Acidobacteriia bacterium]|nr:ABC transporter permease [Terriglobia bacterium]